MHADIDQLFRGAVRVRSVEEIRALPLETEAVHLDVIDDTRAEALSRLPALRAVIHDGNSQLTDQGLVALASLRNLEALDLEWSRTITERGLASLTCLTRLRYLDLAFCDSISAEGVLRLQDSLPRCEVNG